MDPVESYLPTWAFRHSRHHLQWVHLCHCVPRCLARRLTFRSIGRIRKRTIGWISQVIVLLSQKVPLRSTFQRSRGIIEKGCHLFSWHALRVQLVLSPLDQRSSHCAKQASPI